MLFKFSSYNKAEALCATDIVALDMFADRETVSRIARRRRRSIMSSWGLRKVSGSGTSEPMLCCRTSSRTKCITVIIGPLLETLFWKCERLSRPHLFLLHCRCTLKQYTVFPVHAAGTVASLIHRLPSQYESRGTGDENAMVRGRIVGAVDKRARTPRRLAGQETAAHTTSNTSPPLVLAPQFLLPAPVPRIIMADEAAVGTRHPLSLLTALSREPSATTCAFSSLAASHWLTTSRQTTRSPTPIP